MSSKLGSKNSMTDVMKTISNNNFQELQQLTLALDFTNTFDFFSLAQLDNLQPLTSVKSLSLMFLAYSPTNFPFPDTFMTYIMEKFPALGKISILSNDNGRMSHFPENNTGNIAQQSTTITLRFLNYLFAISDIDIAKSQKPENYLLSSTRMVLYLSKNNKNYLVELASFLNLSA